MTLKEGKLSWIIWVASLELQGCFKCVGGGRGEAEKSESGED